MAGGAVIAPTRASGQSHPEVLPRTTWYVVLLTCLACIGGLLFGYDTGVVSSAMLYLPDNAGMKPLSTVWQELIVSITPGVAAIGSLLAGKSSDLFGRRLVIIAASVIFLIGAIICAAAPERWTMLVGRTLLGVAIGFASMIIPVFIGEAAPCHMRGTLITVYQFMISSGFIVANVVAALFANVDPTNVGWRLMFGFAGLPAIIQLIGFMFLSDTPRYLLQKGKDAEAERVLMKIYGDNREWVEYDMAEIRFAAAEEEKHVAEFADTPTIVRIVRTPHVLRALLLGCSMQAFQQLIGINTILYYTGTIIQSAGVQDKITTIWISCGISAIQSIGTFAPMKFIEKYGRRPILLISMCGVIVALCLMGGAFLLINKDSPVIDVSLARQGVTELTGSTFDDCAAMTNCDFCVTASHCGFCHSSGDSTVGQCLPVVAEDTSMSTVGFCAVGNGNYTFDASFCSTKYTVLPIVVMVIYLLAFAFGMGPMPWVFNAEIYPLWARSTCVSLSTFTNWVFNLLIALTFLSLGEAITKYGAFFLYAGFAVCGLVVFYFFVPETKGVEIEEVENLFKTKRERRYMDKVDTSFSVEK